MTDRQGVQPDQDVARDGQVGPLQEVRQPRAERAAAEEGGQRGELGQPALC